MYEKMNSFADIRKSAKASHAIIAKLRGERDTAIATAKTQYIGERLRSEIDGINEEYSRRAMPIKADIIKGIDDFRNRKVDALKKSVVGSPYTAKTIGLQLDALEHRKNITKAEIDMFVEAIGNDYNSLVRLSEIAAAHGHIVSVPTPEEVIEAIDEGVEFAKARINKGIEKDVRKMEYYDLSFFGDFDHAHYETFYADDLDAGDSFSALAPISVEARKLSQNESRVLDSLFTQYASNEQALFAAVNEAAESPELRSLIAAHPEYSKHLYTPLDGEE